MFFGSVVRESASWITSQRWYGDKARNVASLAPEAVVPVDAGGLKTALVLVRVAFDDGPDARYFVPVIVGGGEDEPPRDALRDPAFLGWLLRGFGEERVLEDGATFRWRALAGAPLDQVDPGRARVLSAEQSNTSVVFDDRMVGKVFRRLQAGLNPDLEIGEFLTRHGDFANAPALYGLIELVDELGTTAIAALQAFVPNDGDGWEWLLGRLGALNDAMGGEALEAVALLGRRTGELHVALAADAADPAFAPEPFTEEDAKELNQRIVAEMEQSVEGLAKRLPPDEVAALHKGIGQAMSGAYAQVGNHKIRVHGDYHLGQTLRTRDDDFCIIDFEGEPSRTIDERRAKQSALKDVAGMLRSLDYAVATVSGRTVDPVRRALFEAWGDEAREAFLAAYRDAVRASRVELVPADDRRFGEGLRLFVVEKALYEVRYELNNRPDWLPIPLNALRRLAGVPVPESLG